MAEFQDKHTTNQTSQPKITLHKPGAAGGLQEFVYTLAAILARLDADQRDRVQSTSPQHLNDKRKEFP
jgi:hypothetical protein